MGQPLEVHIRKLQEFYWSEADPDGRGFVPLADALRRAGDLREAHRLLRDGLTRHPDYLSGHVVAAWLSMDRGLLGEAEARFKAALELDPKNIAALKGLAEVLLDQGEIPAALELLETLNGEDPTDLSLPARILELRTKLEDEEAAAAEEEGPSPPLWEDPDRAADEVDLASAVLQPDASGLAPSEVGAPGEEAPGDGELPEDGEPTLVTSTLGEVYLRQGLAEQAAGVFLTLLADDPENEHLKHRLEEAQGLIEAQRLQAQELEADGAGPLPAVEELVREGIPTIGETESPVPVMEPGLVTEVVPIESLAPDKTDTVPIADLAPEEVVSLEDLAPDEVVPVADLAPVETVSISALAPVEPVPIGSLAPDGPIPIGSLAPDGPVTIESLAPDGPIPIEALAPATPAASYPASEGGNGRDPTVDAFERWLDKIE